MYNIKRKVRYSNGRETIMVGYDITDDNGSLIESFVSEGRMEEYARMNRQERKRKEVNKMSTNIHDIDKLRRIEDIGFYYEDGLKYSAKLFIYFDEETGREIESKCFYFLAGPFYRNQMEGLINRMTAQEFDNYLEYPRYARFRLVPAHIESI
uniref:Uncharacterized protein n=1 Tax=Siphoviridae sp. ctnpt50 TaxID=2827941 RepID=A0A8S5SE32_9CAUD|nr:MAG TPA: hypothetical protein [Siphoviridae sp. ctnpt50]